MSNFNKRKLILHEYLMVYVILFEIMVGLNFVIKWTILM